MPSDINQYDWMGYKPFQRKDGKWAVNTDGDSQSESLIRARDTFRECYRSLLLHVYRSV